MNNFRVACSPFSKKIHLIRTGKNRTVALDKKDCEGEVMQAIAEKFCNLEDKTGTVMEYRIREQKYRIEIKPIDEWSEDCVDGGLR